MFCEDLEKSVRSAEDKDRNVFLGDLNTRVGLTMNSEDESIRVGKMNKSDQCLPKLCSRQMFECNKLIVIWTDPLQKKL